MEQVLGFINENSVLIGSVITFIVVLVAAFLGKDYAKVKTVILKLVIEAEVLFNSKDGKAKLDYVLENLYENIPKGLKIFADSKLFKNMIFSIIENVLLTLKTDLIGRDLSSADLLRKATFKNDKK